MKNRFTFSMLSALAGLLFGMSQMAWAQTYNAGKSSEIISNLKGASKKSGAKKIRISATESLFLSINFSETQNGSERIIGSIENEKNASFILTGNANNLEGSFVLIDKKKAYSLNTDAKGNLNISPIDINKVLCVDYNVVEKPVRGNLRTGSTNATTALTNLQSLPGAGAVVLLDFDGHYVPAGSVWNNGNPIDCAPSGLSDAEIQEIWEIVSEDYGPFQLNVTTNEAVYQAAPATRRMRCIITPTRFGNIGGGVAYSKNGGSFKYGNETPCFVFTPRNVVTLGETVSHEVGHTFSLNHDGRVTPKEEYYAGSASWAPIMGDNFNNKPSVTHWSKGEYNYASNTIQDDINIIATNFGFTFRVDDYGNDFIGASSLGADIAGNVNNKTGIIEKSTDLDVFFFKTSGGNLSLNFKPAARHANLNISVTLKNSSNVVVASNSPAGLAASLNLNLAAGTYYIVIDGVGDGDPKLYGYSDYGSLGGYTISGKVPPAPVDPGVTNMAGAYYLQNRNSNLYMDIYAFDKSDGANVVQYKLTSADNQIFDFVHLGEGVYKITARFSGKSLDIAGASTANGAKVQQYTYSGGANQQFIVKPTGDGFYKLVVKHSNKLVEIGENSTVSGASTQQWDDVSQHSAQWKLVAVTPPVSQECKFFTGTPDFTASVSDNKITFNASRTGVGSTTCILYYSTNASGPFPGYLVKAGVPFALNLPSGQKVYFYYTYSVPEGGEKNTASNIQSFTIGACEMLVTTINEEVKETSFNLYPNPTTNFFNVEVAESFNGATVSIIDIVGKQVVLSTHGNGAIDVSELPSGMYIIMIRKEGTVLSKRFIKQ